MLWWESSPPPPEVPWWQVGAEVVGFAIGAYLAVGLCMTVVMLALAALNHHGPWPTPWQFVRGIAWMVLLLPWFAVMPKDKPNADLQDRP